MIKVKLNGKPYNFPTSLAEITLKQWLVLRKSTGMLDDLAILTGLDASSMANFKTDADFKKCLVLRQTLSANFEKDMATAKIPKEVKIGAKTIQVPKTLNMEPIGAFIAAHNLIADEKNNIDENGGFENQDEIILDILCQYFFIHYHGTDAVYSDEAVENPIYRELVSELPYLDAAAIGVFFFRKFPDL